jgi:hypothetical protein
VGRIEDSWETMMDCVMSQGLVKLGATVVDVPSQLAVFSRFQLQMHIFGTSGLWRTFAESPNTVLKDKLYQLMDVIHSGRFAVVAQSFKLPGETQEKINADTEIDALYSSSVGNGATSWPCEPQKVHTLMRGITLRPYQEHALAWMLHRELHEDKYSDGKSIGLALRKYTRL